MTTKLKLSLDTMAQALIEAAEEQGKIDIRIDTFKAVSAYYLGSVKVKDKPEESESISFTSILKKVKESAQGTEE
jgi:hypothetical protein